jgi:hypothetical protein
MSRKGRWFSVLGIGLVATALALTVALGAPQVSLAAGQPAAVAQQQGPNGPGNPYDTYLAEALGITVDELNAAREQAYAAAVDKALAQGLITQAQADVLRDNPRFARRGLGMLLRLAGAKAEDFDPQALLADALGVSVEDLQEAQEKAADAAFEARLTEALENGRITQEQADLMKARRALMEFIREQNFFGKAVEAAVKAGVISQAQADAILGAGDDLGGLGFGPRLGMGRGFGPGGRGMRGFGGRGMRGFGFGPGCGDDGFGAPIPPSAPDGGSAQ